MSFGFGVGDFLAVGELAWKVRYTLLLSSDWSMVIAVECSTDPQAERMAK